jgi:DNA-binding XRE family transcriptional regulator
MGRITRVLTAPARAPLRIDKTARLLERRRPRSYLEWKTLRRWGKLPVWADDPPGYLLRSLREEAGWTQKALANQLACSQQAIAQAERWQSNPTVDFMKRWGHALGYEARVVFERGSSSAAPRTSAR